MLSLDRIFASLPRTERGKAIVIGADPKGEKFLYANGNSIYIRDLKNPFTECDVYTQHSAATSVAQYSPSRFYIASGDSSGKLRIWDTTQEEHILKNEFHALSGPIRDIAWTGDSQRLFVVGDGREKFAVAILADTGASVGDMRGHSKAVNSVDVRKERPFRAVTASEDFLTCFYEGPPFKFKKQNEEHTNFVNCVRYSPDGQQFASASSSGKICLYEGKTSEFISELGSPAHKGGVYSVSFSSDSAKLLSVSGDKTAKLWNLEDRSLIGEWQFGSAVSDMQVSCVWVGNTPITVSVDGSINLLDSESPGKPKEVILGHSKPITAMGISADGSKLISGSTDASIVIWDAVSGRPQRIAALPHKNQIQALACDADGNVYSAGIDDTVAISSIGDAACTSAQMGKLPSQPVDISAKSNLVAIACQKQLLLYRNGQLVGSLPAPGELKCCALTPNADAVAIGTSDTQTTHVYSLAQPDKPELIKSITDRQAEITALSYSHDAKYLAVAYSDRHIRIYSLANDYASAIDSHWCYHTAKVNCLSWAPDCNRLASGSLDCSIIVWHLDQPNVRITAKNAHPMSQITKVTWLDNEQLVSAGQDANIKVWRVAK